MFSLLSGRILVDSRPAAGTEGVGEVEFRAVLALQSTHPLLWVVADTGEPALTRYARVIVEVSK